MIVKDIFHSQFQPNLNKYIDNNNFFRINTIHIDRNLFWPFAPPQADRFINIEPDPVWTGNPYLLKAQVSYDNGQTFKEEVGQLLWGAYFFLSDDRFHYERKSRNLIMMLSRVGGIIAFLNIIFRVIAR